MEVGSDLGQNQGAAYHSWERRQRGVILLQSYRAGRLQLRCYFCDALFNVPSRRRTSGRSTRAAGTAGHCGCRARAGVPATGGSR